ncbi:hypothetical protein GQ600_20992 [Phytophthora cactorum]|nr:hypothetical protein GQ600_20992 [Phytophthora cactorum]
MKKTKTVRRTTVTPVNTRNQDQQSLTLSGLMTAQLVRVSPNSSKALGYRTLPPSENDETKTVNATATLTIDRVEGNFVTCTIPRLTEWQFTAPANPKAPNASTEWWKIYTKTGCLSMQVSMNLEGLFYQLSYNSEGEACQKQRKCSV